MEYLSKSEKETYQIAKDLAQKAQPGDIFTLEGDLGSGKTTFIKGFAKALGIKNEVTSPTFVLLKKYKVLNSNRGIQNLIHVDCYRMDSPEDAYSIGLDEFFGDKEAIILIEWPSKITSLLPKRTKKIKFEYINTSTRKISLN